MSCISVICQPCHALDIRTISQDSELRAMSLGLRIKLKCNQPSKTQKQACGGVMLSTRHLTVFRNKMSVLIRGRQQNLECPQCVRYSVQHTITISRLTKRQKGVIHNKDTYTHTQRTEIKGGPQTQQILKLAYEDFKITTISMLNNLQKN